MKYGVGVLCVCCLFTASVVSIESAVVFSIANLSSIVGGHLASWWVGQKECNRCQKENNLKIYYSNQKSLFILIKTNVKTSQRFNIKPTSAGQIDRSRTSTQI